MLAHRTGSGLAGTTTPKQELWLRRNMARRVPRHNTTLEANNSSTYPGTSLADCMYKQDQARRGNYGLQKGPVFLSNPTEPGTPTPPDGSPATPHFYTDAGAKTRACANAQDPA